MKKFTSLSFMLVAALLIFTSCNKDDDGAPALDAKLLEGTWNLTESEITMQGQSESYDEDATYEFKSDKTLVITEDGFTSEGTYSISGQTISITDDGETMKFDVKELKTSSLILSNTEKIDFFGVSISTETKMFFSK